MTGVISIFVVLLIWRFLILFGSAVFESAGLAPHAAAFEARSALVGAGFTTSQSEYVVRNPAARRTAATLVVLGYFGPAVILALLGVSFVIPTDEDHTERAVLLGALLLGLFLVDRIGLFRLLGQRPARALARRMITAHAVETLIVVGDHAVAAVSIPLDAEEAGAVLAALAAPEVTILAIEPAGPGPVTITREQQVTPKPGERVISLGPQHALESFLDAGGTDAIS